MLHAEAGGGGGGGSGAHTPLYNIVTKMLSSAVSKGQLPKDRFKAMREKVIAKVRAGQGAPLLSTLPAAVACVSVHVCESVPMCV